MAALPNRCPADRWPGSVGGRSPVPHLAGDHLPLPALFNFGVGGPRARPYHAAVSRVTSPELIGREAELQALAGALDAARTGRGSLIVVGGEAGVGKTRLVGEVSLLA